MFSSAKNSSGWLPASIILVLVFMLLASIVSPAAANSVESNFYRHDVIIAYCCMLCKLRRFGSGCRGSRGETLNQESDLADLKSRAVRINRSHWEALTQLHAASSYYRIEEVRRGGCTLSDVELREIGNVRDLRGLHLQCGLGLETISLARLGAEMRGLDFSSSAIAYARSLARDCGVKADFDIADVLDLGSYEADSADFVYSSHGVLRWLPDLARWAQNLHFALRPGGFFYLFEVHPLVFRAEDLTESGPRLSGDYFSERTRFVHLTETHIGDLPAGYPADVAHTDWSLSSVISFLIDAGFQITHFAEHDGCSYSRNGMFPNRKGGLWYPLTGTFPIPLSFSLRATREG